MKENKQVRDMNNDFKISLTKEFELSNHPFAKTDLAVLNINAAHHFINNGYTISSFNPGHFIALSPYNKNDVSLSLNKNVLQAKQTISHTHGRFNSFNMHDFLECSYDLSFIEEDQNIPSRITDFSARAVFGNFGFVNDVGAVYEQIADSFFSELAKVYSDGLSVGDVHDQSVDKQLNKVQQATISFSGPKDVHEVVLNLYVQKHMIGLEADFNPKDSSYATLPHSDLFACNMVIKSYASQLEQLTKDLKVI